jgi:RNA polymerase sigma-70 factor, ECF subfamily
MCAYGKMTLVPQDTDRHLAANEETEWIEAAQKGDRGAFAKLVDKYWDRLFRWLVNLTRNRERAEDIAQETFLKALGAIGSFRAGSNFRAWLFRIGHNNFVNLKRSEKRTKYSLPEDAAAKDSNNAENGVANREALEAISAALAEMSNDFRMAILLHVQEGMAYKEVARILNTTEETARWRVYKARQNLMQVLPPELLPHDK